MSSHAEQSAFKLGFGLMRLPKNLDGTIDVPQVAAMADRFIAAGGTYFDTAYVYDEGRSEAAFKAAVADRYPRGAYTLATKLNVRVAKDEADAATLRSDDSKPVRFSCTVLPSSQHAAAVKRRSSISFWMRSSFSASVPSLYTRPTA